MLNTIKAPMITDSIGNSFGRPSRKLRAPRAEQSKLNCRTAEVPCELMISGNMIVGLLMPNPTFFLAWPRAARRPPPGRET
jgi:hypothetical protein